MERFNIKLLAMKRLAFLFVPFFLVSAVQSNELIVRKELDAIAASMSSQKAYSCSITTRMFEKPGGDAIYSETVTLKKKDNCYLSSSPNMIAIRNNQYFVTVLHETKTVVFQKAVIGSNPLKKGLEEDMRSYFQNVSQCSVNKLDNLYSVISLNYKYGQYKKLEIKYNTNSKVISRMRFFPNPESFDDAGNGPLGGKPFDHFDIVYSGFDFKTRITEKDFSVNNIVRVENKKYSLTRSYSGYRLVVR